MNAISVHPSEGSVSSSQTCDHVVVVAELLRNIRTQVLIKLIKPYTRIHIPFISKVTCRTLTVFEICRFLNFASCLLAFQELNIDVCDVESLLVQCILDK